MNKYKKQWQSYFEGGVEMWSFFGYQYHSYKISKYLLPTLDIPKEGKLVQLGTGLGITIEFLCNYFGENRVIGYDLFNPLEHSNIHFLDAELKLPPDDKLAYVDIDVGSVSSEKKLRKKLLVWAIKNTINGGYILTNKVLVPELKAQNKKYNFEVIELNSFDIPELWKNVHQTRINTKVLIKMKK